MVLTAAHGLRTCTRRGLVKVMVGGRDRDAVRVSGARRSDRAHAPSPDAHRWTLGVGTSLLLLGLLPWDQEGCSDALLLSAGAHPPSVRGRVKNRAHGRWTRGRVKLEIKSSHAEIPPFLLQIGSIDREWSNLV